MGESPTLRPLQPEATGAVMEVTLVNRTDRPGLRAEVGMRAPQASASCERQRLLASPNR